MSSSEKIEIWDDFEIYLHESLGSGGMGEVFKGRQISVDRPVAIKVLNQELSSDPKFLERFKHEASILAKIDDDRIVEVYYRGEKDDKYYYAMEYVEGETLAERIKNEGSLPEDEIIHISIQVAEVLTSAWKHKIVHRDLKPSNIFIKLESKVKVMDFGIAKEKGSDLTQPGVIMGTLEYMAPEQIDSNSVDIRSDIYSLGLVIYKMATGTTPYESDSATTIIWRKMSQKPEPPSLEKPNMSEGLEAIILRCIKKDPNVRYQTPKELIDDFVGLQKNLPVSKETQDRTVARMQPFDSTQRDTQKKKSRKVVPVLVTLMIGFILVAGLGIFLQFKGYIELDFDRKPVEDVETAPSPPPEITPPSSQRDDEYYRYHMDGTRALDRKEYHTALIALEKAKEIKDTPEIRDKIRQVKYAINMAVAIEKEEEKKWTEAAKFYAAALEYAEEEEKARLRESIEFNKNFGEAIDNLENKREKKALSKLQKLLPYQNHTNLINKYIRQCKKSIIDEINGKYNSALEKVKKGHWEEAHQIMVTAKKDSAMLSSRDLPTDFGKTWTMVNQAIKAPEGTVYIPAGEFIMGKGTREHCEGPAHKVSTEAYYIDRREVTRKEYAEFLNYIGKTGDHSYCHPKEPKGKNEKAKEHTPYKWEDQTDDEEPVCGVDFWDAFAYCFWKGKGLQREVEWEKAASWDPVSQEKQLYPWGSTWRRHGGPSPYGVLGMGSGVYEWTQDVPELYPGGSRKKFGIGNDEYRVVRGGAISRYSDEELRAATQTTTREWFHTNKRQKWTGIRCVKDVQ